MKTNIENQFPEQCKILKELFKDQKIDFQQLNEIYKLSEAKWENNLQERFIEKKNKVKFLLITEAAPWTEPTEEKLKYFYNETSGQLMGWIRETFSGDKSLSYKEKLDLLADKGFLLLDTLPFAMNYSGKRNKLYKELVKGCLKHYFLKKINNSKIPWDSNVLVSLSWQGNSSVLIEVLDQNLDLPNGQKIDLTKDLFADSGNQPLSSEKMKKNFKLKSN